MGAYRSLSTRQDRLTGWALVAAVYAAVGAAWFFFPHRAPPALKREERTVLIDIAQPPPPPPLVEQPRPVEAAKEPEGAAGKKGDPSPIVAPAPKIDLPVPSPVIAAPIAGAGSDPTTGTADRGIGPGAGGSGNGRGGDGRGTAAQWLSGGLQDSDYPRSLMRKGVSGEVAVRFTILTNGRIDNCRVERSSGHRELDKLTCKIITKRLRFAPARDAQGTPVVSEGGNTFGWVAVRL